jgi:uncharacterized protein (TIGR03083 family)
MGEPVITLLEDEWASIVALCETFDETQWARATDCPGWTVKDNVSHLVGVENMLRGAPADPAIGERPAHVRNDFGAFNEAAVEARRARPGADVLAEFRTVSAERIAALRALPAEKWDEIGPTPTGQDTYRHFMRMRTFDSWVHEQDMRRAVAIPGNMTGPIVDLVLDWHRRNLGYVVGKRAKAPDGAIVRFALADAAPITVAVTDGRASVVDGTGIDDAGASTTTLSLDVEAFNALLCGRWDASTALDRDRLRIDGDTAIGRQVAEAMGYVF